MSGQAKTANQPTHRASMIGLIMASGMLTVAASLGIALAIGGWQTHRIATVEAGAGWFGGAASGAAFVWAVYLLRATQIERSVAVAEDKAALLLIRTRKAKLVRISGSGGGAQFETVTSANGTIRNYSGDDVFDITIFAAKKDPGPGDKRYYATHVEIVKSATRSRGLSLMSLTLGRRAPLRPSPS